MNKISITPLGTISPYPKANMNCPGFLVEYHNQKILLDCGNGITRMLNFPNDLRNLHIFITHYHFDHYGDIGCIQYASYCHKNLDNISNPINIYLPIHDYEFRKKSILSNNETYSRYNDISEKNEYKIDDMKVNFYNNRSHNIESYVIKLQNNDFKIIYTSDIGNTNLKELIDYSKNSDLIICESSYLRKHNQNSKTHLTAFDAGLIAKLSNSKKLLLTHFWPDENKEEYLNEAKINFKNTEIATEGKQLILRR